MNSNVRIPKNLPIEIKINTVNNYIAFEEYVPFKTSLEKYKPTLKRTCLLDSSIPVIEIQMVMHSPISTYLCIADNPYSRVFAKYLCFI